MCRNPAEKKDGLPSPGAGEKRGRQDIFSSFGEPVKICYGPPGLEVFDYRRDPGDPGAYLSTRGILPLHVPQPDLDHAPVCRNGHQ